VGLFFFCAICVIGDFIAKENVMKVHCAYSLFGLSLFMMVTNIVVKHHVFITRNCITHNASKQVSAMQCDNVDYISAMDGINPQEFVFCNPAVLTTFEHEKKERTQHLFEKLCGIKQVTTCSQHVVLTALAARNNEYDCTQQFGIPFMLAPHGYALQRRMLIKQIASKLIAEKDMLSQKQCRLCALEKLLK
jgi:hypothetical protein